MIINGIKDLIKWLIQILFFCATKLPIRKKTIVFESFLGKQYSDNPKAIYLFIRTHYPEYKLYWSFDRHSKGKFRAENLKVLSRFSLKWIFVMARAEYWITNSRLPLWIPKPRGTTYVQTWHGTPLKKLGVDISEVHMPGTDTISYKKDFVFESDKWDYLVSPNAYSTEVFMSAFKYNKKIIESGYPRNDILYQRNNEKDITLIKKKMNLPLDKKVILYAPTWRDNQFYRMGKYKLDLELDLKKLQKELSDDFIILLRMHYLVAEQFNLNDYEGFAYDYSTYHDINELYLISDVLITDYSSVFFDYANLRRPIIFFTYDIDSYRDELRGFYFDIEKRAPGPIVKTTNEIISYVKHIQNENYELPSLFEDFYNRFCYLEDGSASERVVNELLKNDIK